MPYSFSSSTALGTIRPNRRIICSRIASSRRDNADRVPADRSARVRSCRDGHCPASSVIPSTPPGRRSSALIRAIKLGHREGFGQIIVGSGIEPRNPVLDRIPRRQDQDRESFSGRSRSGQNGETITIGQAKIEDRRVIVDQLERGAGIGGRARRCRR